MKKSILIIVILSIAALCFAGPLQEMHKRVIAGSTIAGGEESCSETPFINYSSGAADWEELSNSYYIGGFITPTSNRDVCQINFYLDSANGDISGKTYTVRLWTVDGNDLDTEIGTSTGVTGDNGWSEEFVSFTFASPVSLTSSTEYAFTLDQGGVDGTNYVSVFFDTADGDARTHLARWDNTGAMTTEWTDFDLNEQWYNYE
jgi:hypothetical protein